MSLDVRSEVRQLAGVLLDDVEGIAERHVARMRELLPSYSEVPAEKLFPAALTITRNLLEAVRDPDADPVRADGHFRVLAETRINQGIAGDEMLQAWRILLEVVREEAHPVADRLVIADDALLEFVEATLRWSDVGMRTTASAYRKAEIHELARLAAEQAALRRVATMVARESAPLEVFAKVTEELSRLQGADRMVRTVRFEPDGTFTILAAQGGLAELLAPGTNTAPTGGGVCEQVFHTGHPGRVDDYALVTGQLSAALREEGICSAVAGPIIVDGRTWGAMAVLSHRALPSGTEDGVAQFAELVSTAISNVESRAKVERLAAEQSALRRVATLAVGGAAPTAVFDAVVAEMEQLLRAGAVTLIRYEPADEVTFLAHRGPGGQVIPPGARASHVDGESATAIVRRTKRPARHVHAEGARGALAAIASEMGFRSSVGVPLVVEGNLWGCIVASWGSDVAPPIGTEERMARFAQLLATAIANAESSEALRRLADEQAALRRVATLAAEGASPAAVFDAVVAEMEWLLPAGGVMLLRYEPAEEVTVLAHRARGGEVIPPGTRASHADGESATAIVWRTRRPARHMHVEGAPGALAAIAHKMGFRAVVGAPIIVDGRLWGCIIANWVGETHPPPDTEERMAKFAELLATAIANADSRDQLTASRARLVTEADEARRRVVRDLHDGAQQRLLQTIVTLGLAQRALEPNSAKAKALIAEALAHARQGNTELRELAHGILPAVLTQGGLRSGISSIVSRLDLPVEVDVPRERFPAEVEASAYFVVAEALTNVVKHARAERAEVSAFVKDEVLYVEVRDNGVGGANAGGQGLVGLSDRVTALGGRLNVDRTAWGETILAATLPLNSK